MKESTLKSPEHVRTFYSTGYYSIENNSIEMFTEIPEISLSDDRRQTYKLAQSNCFDISTASISSMLCIYAHSHPTHREKLASENLIWDKSELVLNDIFNTIEFTNNKIFVITVHDEDFEEWHTDVYKFFIQNHVVYDTVSETYIFDIKALQEFINGTFKDEKSNEEPKTIGGGVLDPAGQD